jgi:raffinose/stachyose/melibiose transport system permease protein
MYPYWFYLPAVVVFGLFFLLPASMAFYYSLTRWTLFEAEFIGLDNYVAFLKNPQLQLAFRNTLIFAGLTSGLKTLLGLPIATLLTSRIRNKAFFRSVIFFPVLISTVAVGATFSTLMQPSTGLINRFLGAFGAPRIEWLGDPGLAIYSIALVDVWKGMGIAVVILMAAIQSIPEDYFDAARLEGGAWVAFRHVIIPLSRNAMFTVILLSLISGLRSFDLIWTLTQGGPGFASDVLTSVVLKQYQAGFYGLSAAGNVLLFFLVTAIAYPLMQFFNRMEIEL